MRNEPRHPIEFTALLAIVMVSLVLLSCLCSCARFSTTQTDVSDINEFGQPRRTITTQAKASTFWDSESTLAQFKASQTDKTQSASVGSLAQSTTSTNVNALIEAVIRAAVAAAVKP